MGDQHHGGLQIPVDAGQGLEHHQAGMTVEGTGRLVAEQQGRLFRDRAGDGHTLLFAAGKLCREVILALGQIDQRQGRGRVQRAPGRSQSPSSTFSFAVRLGIKL